MRAKIASPRRRWWLYSLLILLLLVCAYIVGAAFFVRSVLEKVLFVGNLSFPTQTHDPYQLGYRGDPQQAFGFSFETVRYQSELGEMPAWFIPPADAAVSSDIAAIYVHGIAGHREDGYRHMSVLREAGIPVLLINYRNDDNAPHSPDGLYSFGLTEWRDLDAAAIYMRQRGFKRLIIVGESLGGAITGAFLKNIELQDRILPYDIEAVILDSPALSFAMIVRYQIRNLRLPLSGLIEPVALELFAYKHGTDFTQADSLNAVANFNGRLLVSHGSGDRIVPVEISDRLVTTRYNLTTYLKTYADHLQGWHENPERYRQALRAFLAPVTGASRQ